MRQKLETLLARVGLFVVLASYASFVLGLFRDIAYVFFAVGACVALCAWNLVATFSPKSALSVAERMSNPPIMPPGPAALRSRKKATLLLGGTGCVLLLILVTERDVLSLVSISEPRSDSFFRQDLGFDQAANKYMPVFERDGDQFFYPPNSPSCASPEPSANDRKCESKTLQDIPVCYEGDNIAFAVTKRFRVDWVAINAIRVVVKEYVAAQSRGPCAAPAEPVDLPLLYIARINETDSLPRSVSANLVYEGLETPDARINLTDSIPKRFVVSIDAEQPGLYTYDVEIEVGSAFGRRTMKVFENRTVMLNGLNTMADNGIPAPPPPDLTAAQVAPGGQEEQ